MKKYVVFSGIACVIACLWTSLAMANGQVDDPASMAVAPSTLVLCKEQAEVTIHTAIPFNLVDISSLSMEGLTPVAAFADLRGDLVLKFAEAEVKALDIVTPPEVTLTLVGALENGDALSLTDTVQVKR